MMLRVISTVTIISTGIHLFQYFTIKIDINKGKSYSIDVIPIILSMFEAKLLKNLTSMGILTTVISNMSHKLGNFFECHCYKYCHYYKYWFTKFLNVTIISTVHS